MDGGSSAPAWAATSSGATIAPGSGTTIAASAPATATTTARCTPGAEASAASTSPGSTRCPRIFSWWSARPRDSSTGRPASSRR